VRDRLRNTIKRAIDAVLGRVDGLALLNEATPQRTFGVDALLFPRMLSERERLAIRDAWELLSAEARADVFDRRNDDRWMERLLILGPSQRGDR
jgi:hypothetical protein